MDKKRTESKSVRKKCFKRKSEFQRWRYRKYDGVSDENGIISDTPMVPKARKSVDAESIDINIPRRLVELEEKVEKGKVTHFNESKGYGFIKDLDTQETVFIHINGILGRISENKMVMFVKVRGRKGWNAVHVKPA